MSDKIKEAFQKVKDDINSMNKKVSDNEKKKIAIEREVMLIKQKVVVEEELRGELGAFFKDVKKNMDELKSLREEIIEREKDMQGLVNSTKTEMKLEINKVNQKFENMETQIQEGLGMIGQPLKRLLSEVEKKTLKNEKEKLKLLKKELKHEKKGKGIIKKIVDSLSDD